jgi:hypothetical protein
MRLSGNFYSGSARGSFRHALFVALAACAVGATATAAVILNLVEAPTPQLAALGTSPRVIE